MVREATRSGNILDLFLTTNPTLVNSVGVIPGLSDHHTVRCFVDTKPKVNRKAPRKAYVYRKANWEEFKTYMKSFCDTFMYQLEGNTVEQLWCDFKEALNEGINKFIPNKFVGIRGIYPRLSRLLKGKYGNGTSYTRNLKNPKIRKTVEPSCIANMASSKISTLHTTNTSRIFWD